jgi:hypothetical protein
MSLEVENTTSLPSITPMEVKILELVGIANKNNERLAISLFLAYKILFEYFVYFLRRSV